MNTLYLLRHAKSSWDDPSLNDFDRPLNSRGIRAARFIGSFMRERGLVPELILCSPSTRTRMTSDLLIGSSGFGAKVIFDDRIYDASLGDLLAVIDDHSSDKTLVICHNPGIESLIMNLTGAIEPMPTAALAVLEKIDAAEYPFTLTGVYRPRELMADA